MVEKNYWHELYTRQHIRGVVHFKRCVKHFPAIKIMILPCHFIFYHVLFHYRWRVLPKNSRFIVGDPFPPFISLSYPQTTKFVPNFCWCFRIHPLSFDFFFILVIFSFVKVLIFFQFSPSILICVYDVFRFSIFTFDLLFFSLGFFVKVFVVFNLSFKSNL